MTPRVLTVDPATLPTRVASVGALAVAEGWAVTWTAPRPPSRPSVALRAARGPRRLFVVWLLDGDRGLFAHAGANVLPGGHLPTLRDVRAFLRGAE